VAERLVCAGHAAGAACDPEDRRDRVRASVRRVRWRISAEVRIIDGLMCRFNFRTTIMSVLSSTLIATAALGAARVLRPARAAAAEATPAATPATVPSDPARDMAMRQYLQKMFKIPNIDEIQLGPMAATPLPGIYARIVKVSNDRGQSAEVTLFSDRDETRAIIGRYVNLNADPWGRVDMSPVHLNDRPATGPADAPVTVVEFADFECPFCARAFGQMETLANSTYKGKVRFIYKYYPLNSHPWARTAAIGAECARLQNPAAFWDFARYFYANQGAINPSNVKAKIDEQAKKLQLDESVLNACMAGKSASERVTEDENDGKTVRVSSTPTFFINGVPVVGLPESKVFDYVINSELKGAQKTAAH
jgi:protein-disulfide isomerase